MTPTSSYGGRPHGQRRGTEGLVTPAPTPLRACRQVITFQAARCLASRLVGLRGGGGEDPVPLEEARPPICLCLWRPVGVATPPACVVAGVPSQSPVNAVYKRLERSRVVWCSLVVTAVPTEGYELSRCHIKTYETGGYGIRFPPPPIRNSLSDNRLRTRPRKSA